MNGALARRPVGPAALAEQFTAEKVQLIRNTIMPGSSDGELTLFVEYCKHTGLNPWTRQIWAIPVYDKQGRRRYEFHTGVEGLRLIAARSGEYEGMDGPYFKARGGEWQLLWEEEGKPPYAAKVTVYRRGKAWTHVVKWEEFVRKNRQGTRIGMWLTHPSHALGIAAERHALRKAFPQEFEDRLRQLQTDGEAGPFIRNPDAPATNAQKGELIRLARELEWNDDERHRRASVASFTELTKGAAAKLINEWRDLLVEDGELVEEDPGDIDAPETAAAPPEGSGAGASPSATSDRATGHVDSGGSDPAPEQPVPEGDGDAGTPSSSGPTGPAAAATVQRSSGEEGRRSKDEVAAVGAQIPPDSPAEDPFISDGPHKGKRFSEVAEMDPGYMRAVATEGRTKKVRELAQAWLDHWHPRLGD